jgi:hypothetical protein
MVEDVDGRKEQRSKCRNGSKRERLGLIRLSAFTRLNESVSRTTSKEQLNAFVKVFAVYAHQTFPLDSAKLMR